ncbi:hypothetical protein HFO41_33090 [Rhizobium leguminosarum]|uniref:hypothetical protein n=1 Tax=Rhizobium leguminosarum TaxID=384 RepID=UPI001C92A245|nr:hypothetical protein [Rhizobium leguminosarum]MBY3178793.1 hypothetical protein [Rhizobium leguminosarum]MBY5564929.1 hypothetical protein [Rhizobium leguminosarum]MBY5625584.1 hypothetical protein [Rhizobium leguminosarum]MBY5693602.1 hypothetical protein [Rhizobium leguminosarum]MBY5728285.1 hypothetical protein [Rhizobium leguminosarum]
MIYINQKKAQAILNASAVIFHRDRDHDRSVVIHDAFPNAKMTASRPAFVYCHEDGN